MQRYDVLYQSVRSKVISIPETDSLQNQDGDPGLTNKSPTRSLDCNAEDGKQSEFETLLPHAGVEGSSESKKHPKGFYNRRPNHVTKPCASRYRRNRKTKGGNSCTLNVSDWVV